MSGEKVVKSGKTEKNDLFQFGIFGYNKKDVKVKFDQLKEQYESERKVLINEKRELQRDVDELRKKEQEFDEKNSRFEEVEGCVSSIMNVTQRASERVFEEANSQKYEVAAIVSDTANQIAGLRQEITDVRNSMNHAIDELQERLNVIDKTLISSVSRLVSIKHDVLNKSSSVSDIRYEVDRLLNAPGKDIDISAGVSRSTPVLGQVGASMISESAARVMNSRKNAYYGLASDRTAEGINNLVEQVDYQLAEATADDKTLGNRHGFLNGSIGSYKAPLNLNKSAEADAVEKSDKKVTDGIDMSKMPMETEERTNDYDLFDVEPAESVPASAWFSDPDWFTSSPLISNDKKPQSAGVKKVAANKVSVKIKTPDKKVKVKVKKH